ncbi:MAG TPA: hypothetical protein VJ867_09230 [Gemmatimonadaceae bacterium]|nr:hypothetical protein [Gemmatimonadaceae bacterium]
MFGLALILSLQAADSNYATQALRDFVARASVQNRAAPQSLLGYHANVESELALILRDSLGRETVGQIEQTAATASWDRSGLYELHVQGYRSQSAGAPYSALTFARMYTVPTLFGNRLFLGINDGAAWSRSDSAAWKKRWKEDSLARRPSLHAVHPLAADRDRYYRFTGGDTVATLYSHDRLIRIVRIHVEPIRRAGSNYIGYTGELDFDADRYQLVRMRGRILSVSTRKTPLVARVTGADAVAYVEYENAEINGKYWLPAMQRSEFQAQMGALGDVRPVFRLISRFRSYDIHDTVVTLSDLNSGTAVPLAPPTRARMTFASSDSVSRYDGWTDNLGTSTAQVTAEDFNDLAPDMWKPSGRPRVDYWPRRLDDVVRFNRVEGLYTGVAGTLRFRDAAPGLRASGNIGWAWSENTARGAAALTLERGKWITSVRGERVLATTNDFLDTFQSGRSIFPLFGGHDDADYVDRWIGATTATRIIGNVDRATLTGEMALVQDRAAVRHLDSSPLGGRPYLDNRLSWPGTYARATTTLEYHPRVSGESLSPGIGARVTLEAAQGDLTWQRTEARLAAREYWHGLVFASNGQAGAILGANPPPQAMYEIGGSDQLPGYGYKEFGGDRAAIGSGLIAYHLPVLRKPFTLGMLVVPGISPGVGAGIHGAWTEISSAAARRAILALSGDGVTPLSRPTDGVRATADVRFTLLSGAIGFGLARAIDHPDGWSPFFGFGLSF